MFIDINEIPKFGAKEKKILAEVNKEKAPGNIVKDFDTLLDYIKTQKVLLTKASFLSPETLEKLNDQMTRPIKLDLKRRAQKSYPHTNGLFLLLRVSGLTLISREKSKPLIVIDEEVYASWQELNNYERYCNLLEIWLTRGNPEVIKVTTGFRTLPLSSWGNFFSIRRDASVYLSDGNKRANFETSDFNSIPSSHNLGLLELFGFIEVEHGHLKKGASWQIARVKTTPLGEALLSLLISDKEILEVLTMFWWDDPIAEQPLGQLQSLLQPYFPEWQNNLVTPKQEEFAEGRYIFKVSLEKIWCRISISAHEKFNAFSYAVLSAFDFDSDHLYRFIYETRFGNEQVVNHPYMEEGPSADEVMLGEIALKVGAQMTFHFDFGDDWRFSIVLEEILPEDDKSSPKMLEQHGKPPEQYRSYDDY